MFKKILIILVFSFSCLIPSITYVNATDSSLTDIYQNDILTTQKYEFEEKIYDDILSRPVVGDYEIIESVRTVEATKDQYEDNNSIGTATIISPNYIGKNQTSNYSTIINGTIHRNEWFWGLIKKEVDEDYYCFIVYGKALVTINLSNIPSGCDYDLELYSHDNTKYAEEEQVTFVKRSNNRGTNDENITTSILPGVYYIRINSYDNSFDAQSEYCLSLNVDYNYEDVSISKLRYCKGVEAALWVSDYDPFNIKAFTSHTKDPVGIVTSSADYSTNKFGNPLFQYINDNTEIKHASLYIWDLNLRRALYEIINISIDELQAEILDNKKYKLGIDITSEIVNGISTITSVVLMFVPDDISKTKKIKLDILGFVTTISPSLLECIFNVIMPESLIETKSNYLNYLNVLAAALECNDATNDQEVIKIDSNYKIVTEKVVGIEQTNYYVDFSPSVQSNYLYNSDIISSFQSGAKFNGTIYPLKNLNDIDSARDKIQNQFEDINTGGDTQLLLDRPLADKINVGEYKWYHFTALENGIYTFQTNSEIDTYGEIFSTIAKGYSNDGLIAYNDDGGIDHNFKLSMKIYKGRTIYLRVRGYNWKSSGLYSLYVKKTGEINLVEEYITGLNFGFENEYVDELQSKSVELDSGFSFTTNRIRCGYINNEYLALSAKCKGNNTAYLQIDFNQDIQSFDFKIAIWSNEEYLNQNSSIILETKGKEGIYKTKYIFDISNMSKNKDDLDDYSFCFDEETYGVRIKVIINQVHYQKNKGRIVLSDFIVRY